MKLALIATLFLVGCGGVDLHTVALTWDAIAQPGETYRVYANLGLGRRGFAPKKK